MKWRKTGTWSNEQNFAVHLEETETYVVFNRGVHRLLRYSSLRELQWINATGWRYLFSSNMALGPFQRCRYWSRVPGPGVGGWDMMTDFFASNAMN
jgi:hypothetical protein